MNRRGVIKAGVILVVLLGSALLLAVRFSSSRSLSQQVAIIVTDAATGQVTITNSGPRVIHLSVLAQVFSNGVWHPPKEQLFKQPRFLLGVEAQKSQASDDGSNRLRFEFPERVAGVLPWRVAVLCQKVYPDNSFGQLTEFIARHLTRRDGFAKGDHRGPFDEWVFSDPLGATTNAHAGDWSDGLADPSRTTPTPSSPDHSR